MYKLTKKRRKTKKKAAKRNKKTLKLRLWVKVILGGIIVLLLLYPATLIPNTVDYISNSDSIKSLFKNKLEEEEKTRQEEAKKEEEYQACLKEDYNKENDSEALKDKLNETISLLNKYNVSVYYKDAKSNFSLEYNVNKEYYAASTIKMLDAIYIYEKASIGEIDLDEEMTYSTKYKWGASTIIGKMKYGDKIKLRDLVKYAIIYSDNSAHIMLLDYIGKSTLREYGKSLGAKYTLLGDQFGSISANDSMKYIEKLDELLETNTPDAKELKSYFVDSEQNYLNFPEENIEAAQKYGEYESYYHENGIVYANDKYYISILTLHGKNEKVIRTINSQIYELHKTFHEERKKICEEIKKGS